MYGKYVPDTSLSIMPRKCMGGVEVHLYAFFTSAREGGE
jgi:hypothetical protein